MFAFFMYGTYMTGYLVWLKLCLIGEGCNKWYSWLKPFNIMWTLLDSCLHESDPFSRLFYDVQHTYDYEQPSMHNGNKTLKYSSCTRITVLFTYASLYALALPSSGINWLFVLKIKMNHCKIATGKCIQ